MKTPIFTWKDLITFLPDYKYDRPGIIAEAEHKLSTIIPNNDHINLKKVLDYVINNNPRTDTPHATFTLEELPE